MDIVSFVLAFSLTWIAFFAIQVRQVKRQKYGCRCGHIDTALGPDRVTPGGRYSLEFGVQIAVQKLIRLRASSGTLLSTSDNRIPWSRAPNMSL